MKTTFNHLINNRSLSTFSSIDQELQTQPEKNYLFDLSYLGVIDVIGEKAQEFLQGQLTCDVQTLSDIQIVQGAQCNLKGRILALIDVIYWSGVKLVVPQDILESTLISLNKTSLLSRVNLKKNQALKVLGFYLQNPSDLVPDTQFFPAPLYALSYGANYCCYHLGNGFYIFLAQTEFAETLLEKFSEQDQLLGSLTWHSLRLSQQQLDIYPESRGLFLPHKLDLHQTPYLSFNKGCYKGQEIIARMHYKATLKHQLKIYTINTEEKIYSGQKIYKELGGAELGELVDYSIVSDGRYLVAVSLLKNIELVLLFEGHKKLVTLN